jgi:Ca2+-binding RTX toxin-like protein
MLNTDPKHLPADVFKTPAFILEVDTAHQFNTGLGNADPTGGIMIGTTEVTPLVVRDDPHTTIRETHYLHYTGDQTVVIGGTEFDDDLAAGSSDDDTIYGDGGNDHLEGGFGNDFLFGGAGDDIIQDMGGNDTIHGDAGNDVIVDDHSLIAAPAFDLILGGDGKDFIATTDDIATIFGGAGDDFIFGSKPNLPETGNEGDDWIEKGTQDGAPGDNGAPLLTDDVVGNDIFVGGGGFDEMIGEGGDDIFVGSDAQDKMDGMSGFDWVTYKNDLIGVTVDLELPALNEPPIAASPASILDRFAEVEGLSGSRFSDYLRDDESDANAIATLTATGSVLTNIALINGLQAFSTMPWARRQALMSLRSEPAISFWAVTAVTLSSVLAATI